jgi:hypothetical protein
MLDFQEQKPKVRIDFKDPDSGIHINIQETEHRGKENKDKTCFWISAHYNKDRHYNSFDLSTASLEEAKTVASKLFEFMKELRPQLHLLLREDDSTCGCDE